MVTVSYKLPQLAHFFKQSAKPYFILDQEVPKTMFICGLKMKRLLSIYRMKK